MHSLYQLYAVGGVSCSPHTHAHKEGKSERRPGELRVALEVSVPIESALVNKHAVIVVHGIVPTPPACYILHHWWVSPECILCMIPSSFSLSRVPMLFRNSALYSSV